MSKIVGAKIQENVEYEIVDEKNGTKSTGVINKVEFRCIVKDIGADRVGLDIARYSVDIENLPEVFGVEKIANVKEFCKAALNKECILETKATVYGGKLTERLVGVTFLAQK